MQPSIIDTVLHKRTLIKKNINIEVLTLMKEVLTICVICNHDNPLPDETIKVPLFFCLVGAVAPLKKITS